MVWQPTVVMEKINPQGTEVRIRCNRCDIGIKKAQGWIEIGGDDHTTKIDSVAVKKLQGENEGNGGDLDPELLTPAQMVLESLEGSRAKQVEQVEEIAATEQE